MDTLDRLGLSESTILIVTSDNGGYDEFEYQGESGEGTHNPNEPWRASKSSTYEGGFRVPFIVRWPGKIPAGTVSNESLSLVDMFATLVGAAGGSIPSEGALDSIDVMAQLMEPNPDDDVDRQFVTCTRGMVYISIFSGDWKLILKTNDGSVQLYNLKEDPRESSDLSVIKPTMVEAMRQALNDYFVAGSSRPGAKAEGRELADILKERESRNKVVESLMQRGGN